MSVKVFTKCEDLPMRHSLFFNIFKHFNISDAGHFTHQCNNEFVWGRRLKFVKIKKNNKKSWYYYNCNAITYTLVNIRNSKHIYRKKAETLTYEILTPFEIRFIHTRITTLTCSLTRELNRKIQTTTWRFGATIRIWKA